MYTITKVVANLKYIKAILTVEDAVIVDLAYDTRKVYVGGGSLFFALTNQRDGHVFIAEAYAKGVRNFVVSKLDIDISNFPESNFVWVEEPLFALQELATFHRNQFTFPIIGITGSNGKTMVKEWLFQLLSPEYACFQSPKSYNSQLGVPLSLWKLSADFNIAIIEAGISRPGEMEYLANMIQPTLGIFTSLGTAHREGFSSKAEKLSEKWKLFATATSIVVPSASVLQRGIVDDRLISWGYEANDFVKVISLKNRFKETYVDIEVNGDSYTLCIPFVDQASISNVLTCVTVLLHLGYSMPIIKDRIGLLKPLEMRLKLKKGKNNSSIIDDSYSNDLASLQIALDFLNQQNQFESRILILSDFEGEEWTAKFEDKLLELLGNVSLASIVFVGARYRRLEGRVLNAYFYNTTEELHADLTGLALRNATVLIKGARKYQLEKITSALVEQSHETVLEISLNAIAHNMQQYRAKLAPAVKIMAMVKAFSYGSGSFEIANILQFSKIDYLTVAFVDEGVALRKAGIKLPIMVLSPHVSSFEDLVSFNLEPEIYSLRILANFIVFLRERALKTYPIHLKVDTGMHRLGFMPEEMAALLTILKDEDEVKIISIFSHLVGAGDPSLVDFTRDQVNILMNCSRRIEQEMGYTVLKHICNTSGIIHHPEAHLDMVRLGIGLYGFETTSNELHLEEVSVLKTTITQIKNLGIHETVGYDRKGQLHRDSVIATVKIGYADGYNRRFGNGVGKMLVNGQLAPTVGNICMDMCMLDITDIVANEGDEVLVFPDLARAAQEIGTIPYELLTSISSRVKRVYFYD